MNGANTLSGDWNHSDDEMYYMGYWGLYRYAFNDTLKANYKKAIVDHWQFERPEKDGLWNILTAITGIQDFDLEESVWFLQEYPLDMIDWTVKNSHRKDIELLPPNFIEQLTKEVLPPDEVGMIRHNNSRFLLDRNGRGNIELSAGTLGCYRIGQGDIWGLLVLVVANNYLMNLDTSMTAKKNTQFILVGFERPTALKVLSIFKTNKKSYSLV
ncbi:MAG: hypothetical protein R2822_30620 [Spirosomataceae bacterium]